MAAVNSKSTRGVVSFGKRFVNQIRAGTSPHDPSPSPSLSLRRRGVHVSVYDKNVDDHIGSTVVPDEVIEPQSDKYWAPHPHTGVFGPGTGDNLAAPGGTSGANGGGEESVLEQKAFFRPLEDLEKPIEDLDKSHQP